MDYIPPEKCEGILNGYLTTFHEITQYLYMIYIIRTHVSRAPSQNLFRLTYILAEKNGTFQ